MEATEIVEVYLSFGLNHHLGADLHIEADIHTGADLNVVTQKEDIVELDMQTYMETDCYKHLVKVNNWSRP